MRSLMTTLCVMMTMATATLGCDREVDDFGEPQEESAQFDAQPADALVSLDGEQAFNPYPVVNVVAWSDGNEVRQSAFCHGGTPLPNNRCTCDGLDNLGWGNTEDDNKCKLCPDGGGWPCSLEPSAGTEVSLDFLGGTEVMYAYLDHNNAITPIDTSTYFWTLSCDEPPASCSHTCDPGDDACTCNEDRMEFAVVRPYWNNGERHLNAKGGLVIDLGDTCD